MCCLLCIITVFILVHISKQTNRCESLISADVIHQPIDLYNPNKPASHVEIIMTLLLLT